MHGEDGECSIKFNHVVHGVTLLGGKFLWKHRLRVVLFLTEGFSATEV